MKTLFLYGTLSPLTLKPGMVKGLPWSVKILGYWVVGYVALEIHVWLELIEFFFLDLDATTVVKG